MFNTVFSAMKSYAELEAINKQLSTQLFEAHKWNNQLEAKAAALYEKSRALSETAELKEFQEKLKEFLDIMESMKSDEKPLVGERMDVVESIKNLAAKDDVIVNLKNMLAAAEAKIRTQDIEIRRLQNEMKLFCVDDIPDITPKVSALELDPKQAEAKFQEVKRQAEEREREHLLQKSVKKEAAFMSSSKS